MKIYQKLACLQAARMNCIESKNQEWFDKHTESIEKIMKDFSPSGGGLDNGSKFSYDTIDDEKLIFYTSYHVMNDDGYYTHWIDPITITVKPSLCLDFTITIKGFFGKDQDIKDIIYDRFEDFLKSEIEDNFRLTTIL